MTDIPDEVYAKYIGILSGLPEHANLRSATLYVVIFSTLTTTPIKDNIEESSFVIPFRNGTSTKIMQIKGLIVLRTTEVRSCRVVSWWRKIRGSASYFLNCIKIMGIIVVEITIWMGYPAPL